jgi:hypothetical protein
MAKLRACSGWASIREERRSEAERAEGLDMKGSLVSIEANVISRNSSGGGRRTPAQAQSPNVRVRRDDPLPGVLVNVEGGPELPGANLLDLSAGDDEGHGGLLV